MLFDATFRTTEYSKNTRVHSSRYELDILGFANVLYFPEQSFKNKENVAFFLAACEMVGVPRRKLFRLNDLWENVSMVNVIDCLVALAVTVASKWPGKFPTISLNHSKKLTDEELLSKLDEAERTSIIRQLNMKVKMLGSRKRNTNGYRLSLMEVGGDISQMINTLENQKEETLRKGMVRLQSVYRGTRDRLIFQNMLKGKLSSSHVAS